MLRIEDGDRVRTVTLDRPDARNALTPDGLDALADAVTEAPTPVVHLRGAGDAFCAGADLASVAAAAESESAGRAFVARGQRTMDAIESSDAVVVAGVNGAARGGGVELALAADVRVATPDATFAEPGVTFGLFGAWGGTVRLPEAVGASHAADLSLSGRVVDAEAAREAGLVSRVVPDPADVAAEIAANDPSALAALTRLGRHRGTRAEREAAEADAFVALLDEHADALAAHRNG
ncbi:enoyl-CoA hydratase/isomerase family protein [Halosegnis marinus]|uniref:Enoyl-CoA hydratase/isomerase family protein n=1 Tax=Halosegnis marinus TaxID=3034023 RepID=A0ABD5ZPZ1_9EURY|nr:enoyl-CoA hydratase/isomerase family protein [Halosegnis sp. DT85]